jgi:hypothetical protein
MTQETTRPIRELSKSRQRILSTIQTVVVFGNLGEEILKALKDNYLTEAEVEELRKVTEEYSDEEDSDELKIIPEKVMPKKRAPSKIQVEEMPEALETSSREKIPTKKKLDECASASLKVKVELEKFKIGSNFSEFYDRFQHMMKVLGCGLDDQKLYLGQSLLSAMSKEFWKKDKAGLSMDTISKYFSRILKGVSSTELLERLDSLKQKQGESVQEFLSKFEELMSDLEAKSLGLTDAMKMERFV